MCELASEYCFPLLAAEGLSSFRVDKRLLACKRPLILGNLLARILLDLVDLRPWTPVVWVPLIFTRHASGGRRSLAKPGKCGMQI